MSEIDRKPADSEKRIAEIERQASELKATARSRPSVVSDKDVQLTDRLLMSWQALRTSILKYPEFRERARDLALKKATGRLRKSNPGQDRRGHWCDLRRSVQLFPSSDLRQGSSGSKRLSIRKDPM